MKRLYFFLLPFLFHAQSPKAQDTFSIVAVDEETGEVGSAGASCVQNAASFGGVILLSGIIPGKGGVNAQASICINPHVNLNTAITRMAVGDSPQEILDHLYANDDCFASGFDPESRQYGIVDFDEDGNPRTAAFTGTNATDWKGHIVGDNYAIQGNILLGPEILENMETAFNATTGSLADKLMAAMQGANVVGADTRCADDGTSSTSAFLRVFKPDDSQFNPYLELNVAETPTGEEPIDSLQSLFDEWKNSISSTTEKNKTSIAQIFPNPTQGHFNIIWKSSTDENLKASVVDISGKKILDNILIKKGNNSIELPDTTSNQLLFIQVKNRGGEILFSEKILFENK